MSNLNNKTYTLWSNEAPENLEFYRTDVKRYKFGDGNGNYDIFNGHRYLRFFNNSNICARLNYDTVCIAALMMMIETLDTNNVVHIKRGGKIVRTSAELAELCHVNKNVWKSVRNKLEKADVIRRTMTDKKKKFGYWTVNPAIFCASQTKYLNESLIANYYDVCFEAVRVDEYKLILHESIGIKLNNEVTSLSTSTSTATSVTTTEQEEEELILAEDRLDDVKADLERRINNLRSSYEMLLDEGLSEDAVEVEYALNNLMKEYDDNYCVDYFSDEEPEEVVTEIPAPINYSALITELSSIRKEFQHMMLHNPMMLQNDFNNDDYDYAVEMQKEWQREEMLEFINEDKKVVTSTVVAKAEMDEIVEAFNEYLEEEVAQEWANEFGVASETTTVAKKKNTESEMMNIFYNVLLQGETPRLYCFDANMDHPLNTNALKEMPASRINTFFLTQNSKDFGTHKEEDITSCRMIACDFDFGKRADKSYLSDEELAEAKSYFRNVMQKNCGPIIPQYTCLTETRNGFHMTWSINTCSVDEWLVAAEKIKDVIKTIIDPVVTANVNRILRMPGSIHKKRGTDAFETRLVDANDITYNVNTLALTFETNSNNIKSICDDLISHIPSIENTNKETTHHKSSGTRKSASGSNVTAPAHHLTTRSEKTIYTCDQFDALRKLIDLPEYLRNHNEYKNEDFSQFIALGVKIYDPLKQTDSNPSAIIYYYKDSGYRLIAYSDNSPVDKTTGWDICDIYAYMNKCTRDEARDCLCKQYNIKYRKNASKVAVA